MSRTEYVLSLSYGKDSLACLEAIRLLGYPLDRTPEDFENGGKDNESN